MSCRSGIASPPSRQMEMAALAEIPPQKHAAMMAAARWPSSLVLATMRVQSIVSSAATSQMMCSTFSLLCGRDRVLACPASWAGQAPARALHQPPLIQAPDVERVTAVQHSARFPLCKVVQADHAQLSGDALRRRAEPLEKLPTVVAVMSCRSGIGPPPSSQMKMAALAEIPPLKHATMMATARWASLLVVATRRV
eukprot:CAMPEP_0204092914 /NCGR_PEP_ID=MMETSP0360-20130528/190155_1 /ASSEMBLY_ACC=CAM_ASM_000342 /TAXON_ID=268821 /ORGANISM="Scrippsiella Hangoei, Strain SHTV-5" /LENGTH=195 /DNA_ID=CAMNT_0051042203 /DNA_START=168 /DNA_END=756 /DNA_ORIENTATION=-